MCRYSRRLSSLLVAALIAGTIAWPVAAGHAASLKATPHAQPAAARSTAAKKAIPGWPGGNAKYIGRYHLVKSSDSSLATGGELTLFTMVVRPAPKPVLRGILTLTTKSQTNVVYLTKFVHAGSALWTTVNLGIYTGPVLGQFKVISIKGEQLVAALVQPGAAPVTLQFIRFSTNPHP